MTYEDIIHGDCLEVMADMPDNSVNCCVTSPPYWGLRDYGHDGQIGLEQTPEEYVAKMVDVFREVRRVLRTDGNCYINLGDSYASGGTKTTGRNDAGRRSVNGFTGSNGYDDAGGRTASGKTPNLKPKDLVGVPWRVAFALQADGWWLRQDIIWHKPNPMPESVKDRCTKSHEYMFHMTKSARYWYDAEAVKEALQTPPHAPGNKKLDASRNDHDQMQKVWGEDGTRNRRSVWTVATKPYGGAHFATFPPKLIEPCILAGCPRGGVVLDPFAGSGTTLAVALQHGRQAIGIELNAEYIRLIEKRLECIQVELI